MRTFFEINRQSKIGYKKLSEADLGTGTSHQTHIGLFADTLEFINETHKTSSAKLIYQNKAKELVCLLNYIENPDGSFRSPKIRKGDNTELEVDGVKTNSVVGEIHEIVKSTYLNENWYLLWFGLQNTELVFYLFRQNSNEYNEILALIPTFSNSGRIENTDSNFVPILKYLETKTENSSIEFLQELELIAQTDEVPIKLIKPRFFDIEKAKLNFAITGKKGEELIAIYLEKLKFKKQISNYKWINQTKETGYPYDFEINTNGGDLIYKDVKTTSYTFEQAMIFSKNEMSFIKQSANYHVYRVFDLKEENPALRICENISTLSNTLVSNISTFETEIFKSEIKLNSLKLAIAPTNKLLNFNDKIILT
ncbi:MAG: DUF3883 domain-containing protein [bacterium]|nr:DUF3883 domain-containing protein [bacterium]